MTMYASNQPLPVVPYNDTFRLDKPTSKTTSKPTSKPTSKTTSKPTSTGVVEGSFVWWVDRMYAQQDTSE